MSVETVGHSLEIVLPLFLHDSLLKYPFVIDPDSKYSPFSLEGGAQNQSFLLVALPADNLESFFVDVFPGAYRNYFQSF